jgi:hypothetical protein
MKVERKDLLQDTPEGIVEVTKIEIEDSLGRRVRIRGLKRQIQQLRGL